MKEGYFKYNDYVDTIELFFIVIVIPLESFELINHEEVFT